MFSNSEQWRTVRKRPVCPRFPTPDPSGLASGSPANPQSLNLYAYVGNGPIDADDPLGLGPHGCKLVAGESLLGSMPDFMLDPCDMPGLGGGEGDEGFPGDGGGSIDGGPTLSGGLLGALAPPGSFDNCPGGDCSILDQPYTAGNGQIYELVAGANGLTWLHNGEELGGDDVAELGLPDFLGSLTSSPFENGGAGAGNQGGGSSEAQCEVANIRAVNQVSTLNVTALNVTKSLLINGAWNYNFLVAASSTSALLPGRYPSSLFNAITGIGPSLHVPAPGGRDYTIYGLSNGNFMFTTHIDSAYATWHTPIGALIHWIVDVRNNGAHRSGC